VSSFLVHLFDFLYILKYLNSFLHDRVWEIRINFFRGAQVKKVGNPWFKISMESKCLLFPVDASIVFKVPLLPQ